jgi:multidrug resistance efflux pump
MAQAINDRIDQLVATVNAEKAEVAAALQALRDEIAQGRLDEAQIVARLDGAISDVQGIHVPTEPPNPVV